MSIPSRILLLEETTPALSEVEILPSELAEAAPVTSGVFAPPKAVGRVAGLSGEDRGSTADV